MQQYIRYNKTVHIIIPLNKALMGSFISCFEHFNGFMNNIIEISVLFVYIICSFL